MNNSKASKNSKIEKRRIADKKRLGLEKLFEEQKKALAKTTRQMDNLGLNKEVYALFNKKINALEPDDQEKYNIQLKKIEQDAALYVDSGDLPEALKSTQKRRTRSRLKKWNNPNILR